MDSVIPIMSKESSGRRIKFIKTVCFLFSLIVVSIIIAIALIDTRASTPIEIQLIKMFDVLPKEFKTFLRADTELYKNFYTINFESTGKFPIRTLVSNGTITMKEEFRVNNFTSVPSFFNVGSLTF